MDQKESITRVEITSFKDTGKWNVDYSFTSTILAFDHEQIQKQAEEKYPALKESNYTLKCESGNGKEYQWNYRLITNCKKS